MPAHESKNPLKVFTLSDISVLEPSEKLIPILKDGFPSSGFSADADITARDTSFSFRFCKYSSCNLPSKKMLNN